MHGQSVFEAVHAAGVFGHIAADGAGNLTAGIGGVVQAVGGGRFADRQIAHAALHNGCAAGGVDFEDLVELGQRQRYPQRMGHGTARKPCARTARHNRCVDGMAGLQHCLYLLVRFGQADHQGPLAVGGQAVALIRGGVFAVPQQGVRRHVLGQGLHYLGLAGSTFRKAGSRHSA